MAVDYFLISGAPGSAMSPTIAGQVNYADFNISLYSDNGLCGSVTYTAQSLQGDTAVALTDYGTDANSLTGTVTLGPGNPSDTIQIPIPYTDYSGSSRSFHVILSNPTGGIPIMAGSVVGTINYAPPYGGNASIVEGDSGTKNLRFAVTLTGSVTGGFDVAYATADGTAFGNAQFRNDYTPQTSSLHFSGTNGEQKVITVLVNGDTIVERNETLLVNLGNVTNVPAGFTVTKTNSSATGTITDNDSALVSINDPGSISEAPPEGAGFDNHQYFYLTLSAEVQAYGDLAAPTVNYTVNNITTEPEDWQDPQGGVVAFSATQGYYSGSAQLSITIVNDNVTELNEDYEVRLTSVSAPGRSVSLAGSGPTANERVGSATITNDDQSRVTIAGGQVSVNEADTSVTFTITLTNPVDVDVFVEYRTSDGTQTPLATPGEDYTASEGSVKFTAGETSKSATISLSPDGIVEGDEWFKFEAYDVTGNQGRDVAVLSTNNSRNVEIRDDDYAELSISSQSMMEPLLSPGFADMIFVLTLSKPVAIPVTVHVATRNGTALAGADKDYEETTQDITFTPGGSLTKSFAVRIYHDLVIELTPEEFYADLSNLSAGSLATGSDPRVKIKKDISGSNVPGIGTISDLP